MDKSDDQFPSQVADKYVVRFPDGMRDQIKAAAEANRRSMNAEIVARVQGSFIADDSCRDTSAKLLLAKRLLQQVVVLDGLGGFRIQWFSEQSTTQGQPQPVDTSAEVYAEKRAKALERLTASSVSDEQVKEIARRVYEQILAEIDEHPEG